MELARWLWWNQMLTRGWVDVVVPGEGKGVASGVANGLWHLLGMTKFALKWRNLQPQWPTRLRWWFYAQAHTMVQTIHAPPDPQKECHACS
jgi:hypothetical protein